ncbi:MAG: type 1 glutamine amidotransferase, partial [Acidobacteriota bacterium]
GAGGHSATHEHPFTEPLTEVVHRLIEAGRPLFGSCWGHQFLAHAFGGTVIADHENAEVGTHPVRLTAEGLADPLFEGFPERFTVQLGHHDRIGVLPPDFEVLARSERCPHQAIRLSDRPVYGSQFHSELTESHIRERLLMYRDEYLPPDADPALLDRILGPSPQADDILDRFLTLYT